MVYTTRGNTIKKYTSYRVPTTRSSYSWGSVPWTSESRRPFVDSVSSAERVYEMDDQKGLINFYLKGSYLYKTHDHILSVTSDLTLKFKEDIPAAKIEKLNLSQTTIQYVAGDFSDPNNGIANFTQMHMTNKSYKKDKMPPNITTKDIDVSNAYLEANQAEKLASQGEPLERLIAPQAGPRKYTIMWKYVIMLGYQHFAAMYGLYLLTSALWITIAFNCFTYYLGIIGATAGAHRLWSHRSYKATKPLQVFLTICHCISGQSTIFLWARDHRLHHKYSDTDADPHNASRGFFFSHIGWTLVDRHPEIYKRGKLVDMTDIINNPIVMFQKRHEILLNIIFTHIIPTIIPIFFWNETLSVAYHVNMFRYILSLNGTFSINSLAHMFGNRPYDKGICPTQNIVTTLATLGEGFHNYHHTFPQDYKAGELGSFLNFSTSFINFCAWVGLAYDLRFVSKEMVRKKMQRTGDGTNMHDIFGTDQMKKFCHPEE